MKYLLPLLLLVACKSEPIPDKGNLEFAAKFTAQRMGYHPRGAICFIEGDDKKDEHGRYPCAVATRRGLKYFRCFVHELPLCNEVEDFEEN